MRKTIPSFHFAHIPLNVDRSSINVFQHVKETFSLKYAIFDPKSIHIYISPLEHGWFRKKGLDTVVDNDSLMLNGIRFPRKIKKKEFELSSEVKIQML
ncbi:MAG: hypothetical protein ACFFB5_20725 [Promethearchaeota archaeon]